MKVVEENKKLINNLMQLQTIIAIITTSRQDTPTGVILTIYIEGSQLFCDWIAGTFHARGYAC